MRAYTPANSFSAQYVKILLFKTSDVVDSNDFDG